MMVSYEGQQRVSKKREEPITFKIHLAIINHGQSRPISVDEKNVKEHMYILKD